MIFFSKSEIQKDEASNENTDVNGFKINNPSREGGVLTLLSVWGLIIVLKLLGGLFSHLFIKWEKKLQISTSLLDTKFCKTR